jgi:sugar lactone lactonase YvrE
MSGPTLALARSAAASLALASLLAPPAGASPPIAREAPPGAPSGLRTELILDRERLEALGISRPSRLAYDGGGNLYVLDPLSRRVVKIDPRGIPLLDLGGYGEDEASFSLPSDFAIDSRQSLLVLDRGKGAIVAFDGVGRFLAARSLGSDIAQEAFAPSARLLVDPFGALWILASRERDLVPLDERLERARRSRFLAPEESLGTPAAAAFLPSGGVWIYDEGSGALRRYGASGGLVGSIPLADSSGVARPSDLGTDGAGFLYVSDVEGQRVLVYEPDGGLRFARSLGGPKSRWRPAALAVCGSDRIAIADPERGEIQILAIDRERAP